jgi:hypothetical protein
LTSSDRLLVNNVGNPVEQLQALLALGHVAGKRRDVLVGEFVDEFGPYGFQVHLVARDQQHVAAEQRKFVGAGQPYAAAGTGDQRGAPIQSPA